MRDSQGLEVSINRQTSIDLINQITEILFRRQSGLDTLLPSAADQDQDCAMLQFYTAIMFFFSFSQKTVATEFPKYLNRVYPEKLNNRERLYFDALTALMALDFTKGLEIFTIILKNYPKDKVAILMAETCGFLSGKFELLENVYEPLSKLYANDPDFIAMHAFLYCHIGKNSEAKKNVAQILVNNPDNAWLQHVYIHTLSSDEAIENEIQMLEKYSDAWSKQGRFFEGHNWMHLCTLRSEQLSFDESIYTKHIWGEAKSFSFEQNNAFLTLWNVENAGHKINPVYWQDLAEHARPFAYDYFTPYLTVTAILALAKNNMDEALQAANAMQNYIDTLDHQSERYDVWNNIAMPVLTGSLAYIKGGYQEVEKWIEPVQDKIKLIGHSDEQREIFPAMLARSKQLILRQTPGVKKNNNRDKPSHDLLETNGFFPENKKSVTHENNVGSKKDSSDDLKIQNSFYS